jgi:hypothetical protein
MNMEKEFVLHTAETIRQQLVTLTNPNILFSWGIGQLVATVIENMAALKFKVNGRLHKGAVIIALNEGVDYYEIFLQDASGTRKVAEDIDFEQLGEVIDRHIERGENAAEYNAFCETEYRKLMRGDFS